ncbi:hypothetical protein [Candidatus Magnetaquiglobus chichijimensis]|uniref:hypothetical protein n=1 Tax=Candidatus Magnetaquiglobus chichijimensis TaxID=3141448 RepID=UPI003B96FA65
MILGLLLPTSGRAEPDPLSSRPPAGQERQPRTVNKGRAEPQSIARPPQDEPDPGHDSGEGIHPPERRTGESPRG